MKKIIYALMGFLIFTHQASGAIKTEKIDYSTQEGPMQGFVAFDDSKEASRPGILIVHDWMGLGPFTEDKAKLFAKEGYVAFAVDLYGKGIQPKNHDEAGQLAKKYLDNRPLLREHIKAAYDKLISMKNVDPNKIAIMGYCLGGTAALELARSGAPLVGTISLHGILSNPTPLDAKNIKGHVLILHGAEDPHVPSSQVNAFKDEMKKAGINMEFISYPGAVHGFTNPAAGNDKSEGVAYDADADKKSWKKLNEFLKQVFK